MIFISAKNRRLRVIGSIFTPRVLFSFWSATFVPQTENKRGNGETERERRKEKDRQRKKTQRQIDGARVGRFFQKRWFSIALQLALLGTFKLFENLRSTWNPKLYNKLTFHIGIYFGFYLKLVKTVEIVLQITIKFDEFINC